MHIPFKIGEKEFLIHPYTSKQEKEILLLASFEVYDFERIFEVLNFHPKCGIENLSDNEMKVLLYKFRDLSIGDEVEIRYTCDHCKHHNESTIEATNFIIPSLRNDEDIKKMNIPVTDENLQEFVIGTTVEDLDIDDFFKLKQRVKDNQIDFDFIKSTNCLRCRKEKTFDMSKTSYIFEIMSDDTLMTLYKSYHLLNFMGKYSKEDIDNMYPFERSIFTGLLHKTKEDLA